jgi:ABC-type transport system substrate-binding protein
MLGGLPTTCCLPQSTAPLTCLYPVAGPDLARARQLTGHVQATAIMYTPNQSPWLEEAQIVRANLEPLGIDVQVKEFPIDDYFVRIGRRGEPFDLAMSGWASGTTDPGQALANFDGSTIHASDNTNFSTSTTRRSTVSCTRRRSCPGRSATAHTPSSSW